MAAQIGHRFAPRQYTIDPTRVEDYVTALGVDPEPGYRAQPGAAVPPGFLMYVTSYGAAPIHDVLQLDMFRTVFGGTAVEFREPVRVGDELTVAPWISNIVTKSGRSGPLTFVEITVEYANRSGTVVAVERSSTVQRGDAP